MYDEMQPVMKGQVTLFENILKYGTFVGLHFLDGIFELSAGLVPLVDACEEVLLINLAAHD